MLFPKPRGIREFSRDKRAYVFDFQLLNYQITPSTKSCSPFVFPTEKPNDEDECRDGGRAAIYGREGSIAWTAL